MLEIRRLGFEDVLELTPRRFDDGRGFFVETYNAGIFAANGIETTFVQDNHSYSAHAGTLRGLHYQLPPRAQAKLVRVVRGRAFDVVVDVRRGSSTFARWLGIELSAVTGNQILVPAGFAHGFVTLEPDTEVLYKVSDFYSPDHDRAIRFDDPEIAIDWPVDLRRVRMSAKDENAPLLANAAVFEGIV
ncbi:dTDP-4-dehydrorhamnose 3,5-epimerase [Neorhizobium galegae]|uniref:dTDP-4-dehydrorhamnose 3,5-epimerase n=1 Tax=Neorhizobium galegae TaxID=399 RepID=UPI001AEADEA7|nr:dTDP-4-dehydrorhamnose 3,5-epimerase [Neorhizobium galegae]MBP2557310.1 dTDP-4-dehydrorhamnose 3,5-epimerase [Neorhizobium galegae]